MKKRLFENVRFEIILTNEDVVMQGVDVHLSGAEDFPKTTGLGD